MMLSVEPKFVESIYHLADNSKRNYISRINRFKKWCDRNSREEDQSSAIVFAMNYKSTYSTNQVLAILKQYLKVNQQDVDMIRPVRVVEIIKPHLNEKQLHTLLTTRLSTPKSSESESTRDMRNILIFRFMSYGGLRVSEVVGLMLEDIDLVNKSVRIHGGHVKGNKNRLAYIDKNTVMLLKAYINRTNLTGSSAIFSLTTSNVRKILKDYLKKAKLPMNISPHRLRDTFAIRFMNKGGDVTKLMRLMGHSKITTTQGYLQYTDKMLQGEYEKVLG